MNPFQKLLYESDNMALEEVSNLLSQLKVQKQRWLGTNHPDSNIRRLAFKSSGVEIGEDVFISIGMVILDDYKNIVTIGDRVAFGNNVSIIAASGPNNSHLSQHPDLVVNTIKIAPVNIRNDSWVGSGAIILPGITVGEMSLIGAGSVVTKDISPYSVLAGVPGKVIRTLKNN